MQNDTYLLPRYRFGPVSRKIKAIREKKVNLFFSALVEGPLEMLLIYFSKREVGRRLCSGARRIAQHKIQKSGHRHYPRIRFGDDGKRAKKLAPIGPDMIGIKNLTLRRDNGRLPFIRQLCAI